MPMVINTVYILLLAFVPSVGKFIKYIFIKHLVDIGFWISAYESAYKLRRYRLDTMPRLSLSTWG